jgi:ATP-dependent Clp protease ATP-binding subunit ClpC
MNAEILNELKIVVERAVRPVRATLPRKRKMREELLAHLAAICEEEVARLGDEGAAVERTKQRFGDPRELSRQLRDTVPWWNRFFSFIERTGLQPGESLVHLAGKQLVVILVAVGVMMLWTLPWMIARGRPNEIGVTLRALLVSGLFGYSFGFLFSVMPLRIGRALHGRKPERSLAAAGFYFLLSLTVVPLTGILCDWLLGRLTSGPTELFLACCVAPAAPTAFLVTARKKTEEMLYQEEWARLDIGE